MADRRERKNDFSYSVARSGPLPRRPPAAERLRHDTHPSRKSFLFHIYGIRP